MPVNPLFKFGENFNAAPDDAKCFWSGGPVDIAERTYFASMFSGVIAFDTDEGIVLVDSGLKRNAEPLAAMIRSKTDAPIHTAIFTQGHVDHAFGLKAFLAPGQNTPRVVAHRNMPARFLRYEKTAPHNTALNARQFGGTVEAADGTGQFDTFERPEIEPNVLYDERIDLVVGGETFEVHFCPGETDDHSWVYAPARRVLCPGDLFIWAVPNAGNPQKVQRYPWTWAAGLRAMAAKQPLHLCPGHGGPIISDAAKIQTMLLETADFLDAIVERTVALLNAGSPPHTDIVSQIALPKSESPWLQPVYDEAEFIVRNVIRFYGGWWTGRPSELKPAPRDALAREIASLCGDAQTLAIRAAALAETDMRLASHLADFALEAAPGDEVVQAAVAALYERRAEGESSLMAINLFSSAAAYAKAGRPFR